MERPSHHMIFKIAGRFLTNNFALNRLAQAVHFFV
jgi:hypothetical protein